MDIAMVTYLSRVGVQAHKVGAADMMDTHIVSRKDHAHEGGAARKKTMPWCFGVPKKGSRRLEQHQKESETQDMQDRLWESRIRVP
mgnify:CR=1 FL=1